MTGTGYFTADFNHWGGLPLVMLVGLMFVGGCAGSTTCGIKVFRFQVAYEVARVQIARLLQPHGVFLPYFNRRPIADDVAIAVIGFFFAYVLCFIVLALALGVLGLDLLTSLSGAATAISNVGPGIGDVIGPLGNYGQPARRREMAAAPPACCSAGSNFSPSWCFSCHRSGEDEHESRAPYAARDAAAAGRLRHHLVEVEPRLIEDVRDYLAEPWRRRRGSCPTRTAPRPISSPPSGPRATAASCCRAIPTWCRSTARTGRAIPSSWSSATARLFGRGTTDMKGFIATALALVPDMVAARPKTPLHFAFSYDEEVGCLGVRPLLALLARELPNPRLAIIGEPTEMKVASAHKGVYSFHTTVTGREAHSSASHLGVSAIAAAARIVDHIYARGRGAGRDRPPPCRLRSALHHPQCRPDRGRHGAQHHRPPLPLRLGDPARCRAPTPRRSKPASRASSTAPSCRPCASAFPAPASRPRSARACRRSLPQEGSPAEALVLALTGQNRAGAVPFASEAGLFQEQGIPAVLCGPGSVRQAHQPNEFVETAQIASCEAFLRKLIAWAAEAA